MSWRWRLLRWWDESLYLPRKREAPLRDEIAAALNRHSVENGSNTPDFILAKFLTSCLSAFDVAVNERARWYGRHDRPAAPVEVQSEGER